MKKDKVIFILAGSYKQFQEYVRPRQEEGITFVYADFPDRIAGYRPDQYSVIGTFWDRGDANKMFELVKSKIMHL